MKQWMYVAVIAAAVGCDKGNDEGAKRAQSSSPAAQESHDSRAADLTAVAAPEHSPANPGNSSGPGTPTEVTTTRPDAVSAASVLEARRQEVNNQVAVSATQPGGQAQEGAQQLGTQVQTQVDQALAYVKEKKYDLAEKALDALDKQRATWTAANQQAYGPKIDMARKALNAAKGGSSALDSLKGALPSGANK